MSSHSSTPQEAVWRALSAFDNLCRCTEALPRRFIAFHASLQRLVGVWSGVIEEAAREAVFVLKVASAATTKELEG